MGTLIDNLTVVDWTVLSVAVGCLSTFVVYRKLLRQRTQSTLPLPPGPKGKPIIGNLLDLPASEIWLKATEWKDMFGDIVHLEVAGTHMIFLNKFEDTINLFEKRSNRYSERALSEMSKLTKFDNYVALTPYGDKWRLLRRIMAQEYDKSGSISKMDVQERHAHNLLYYLMKDSDSYSEYAKTFASGIIMETAYGLHVKPKDDPYAALVETAASGIVESLTPGAFMVDLLPILRFIPKWFPGASFKRKAAIWEKELEDSCRIPYEFVRNAYETGNEKPSLVNDWFQKVAADPHDEENRAVINNVRHAAGAAMIAGYHTTAASIMNFLYMMLVNSEVQRKGQDELDRVVGRHRLPQYSDVKSLPYIVAIVKETLRRFPIAPVGVPHCAMAEDEYKGMRIPKGSVMMANIWAMVRETSIYGPDPEAFRPERHLEPTTRDPSLMVFGFGRRICPGRHLAENGLIMVCACILHAFTISKALNEDGSEVPFEPVWVAGIAISLEPFPCSITPRFPEAEALVDEYFQGNE